MYADTHVDYFPDSKRKRRALTYLAIAGFFCKKNHWKEKTSEIMAFLACTRQIWLSWSRALWVCHLCFSPVICYIPSLLQVALFDNILGIDLLWLTQCFYLRYSLIPFLTFPVFSLICLLLLFCSQSPVEVQQKFLSFFTSLVVKERGEIPVKNSPCGSGWDWTSCHALL